MSQTDLEQHGIPLNMQGQTYENVLGMINTILKERDEILARYKIRARWTYKQTDAQGGLLFTFDYRPV